MDQNIGVEVVKAQLLTTEDKERQALYQQEHEHKLLHQQELYKLGENPFYLNVKVGIGAYFPTQEKEHDVGYDLRTPIDFTLDPLTRKTIGLGIFTDFAPGFVGRLCPRSGLASKNGIMVLGGVIDPGYRNEWNVILYNSSRDGVSFIGGDRVCQVVFYRVGLGNVKQVDELPKSDRGEGGLGSTGR